MLATTTNEAKSNPIGLFPRAGFSDVSASRFTQADFSYEACLLDAAVAGIVLDFNPRDDEMREKAERAWATIRTLLGSSPGKLRPRRWIYAELRSLARIVDSVSFEIGSDAEISSAGRALCRLAVKLRNLMEAH